ncbi:hypothetical protein GCM10022279_16400 [Comamonas faecalis]|uniref:Uncharacterized protein n=1 Tax=Comamonas faecalis TaxID=1387849 RepID=A0ABP7R7G7_9BURK
MLAGSAGGWSGEDCPEVAVVLAAGVLAGIGSSVGRIHTHQAAASASRAKAKTTNQAGQRLARGW